MKQESTTKAAPTDQQRTDSNSDTGNPASGTNYTTIRASSDMPASSIAESRKADVIILSD